MSTEYRVWCESGDLVGYYKANEVEGEVEDYSTGSYVETHYLGHPDNADLWASRQADALLEKTIKEAPEDLKGTFSFQVVEGDSDVT